MINDLISGEMSVSTFEEKYYSYFLNDVPDDCLSPDELDFFGIIQEKLDFTAIAPDTESRRYGWIDHKEFIVFVEKMVEDIKSTKGSLHVLFK